MSAGYDGRWDDPDVEARFPLAGAAARRHAAVVKDRYVRVHFEGAPATRKIQVLHDFDPVMREWLAWDWSL